MARYIFQRFENLYQSIDRNRRSRKGNLWNDYSGRISIRAIENNDCGSKRMKWVRPLILFGIGGTIYVLIELIARGRSHWTMFFVGGLAFYLIGCINEHKKKEILMRWQMAAGAGIITGLELISGIIVNIILGWNVWDYSTLPGNLLGQICPQFTVLWFFLSAVAVYLDDWIRYLLWGEKRPKYKF